MVVMMLLCPVLEQKEARAATWAQIDSMVSALNKAGDAEHNAVIKLRADLGLPPPA